MGGGCEAWCCEHHPCRASACANAFTDKELPPLPSPVVEAITAASARAGQENQLQPCVPPAVSVEEPLMLLQSQRQEESIQSLDLSGEMPSSGPCPPPTAATTVQPQDIQMDAAGDPPPPAQQLEGVVPPVLSSESEPQERTPPPPPLSCEQLNSPCPPTTATVAVQLQEEPIPPSSSPCAPISVQPQEEPIPTPPLSFEPLPSGIPCPPPTAPTPDQELDIQIDASDDPRPSPLSCEQPSSSTCPPPTAPTPVQPQEELVSPPPPPREPPSSSPCPPPTEPTPGQPQDIQIDADDDGLPPAEQQSQPQELIPPPPPSGEQPNSTCPLPTAPTPFQPQEEQILPPSLSCEPPTSKPCPPPTVATPVQPQDIRIDDADCPPPALPCEPTSSPSPPPTAPTLIQQQGILIDNDDDGRLPAAPGDEQGSSFPPPGHRPYRYGNDGPPPRRGYGYEEEFGYGYEEEFRGRDEQSSRGRYRESGGPRPTNYDGQRIGSEKGHRPRHRPDHYNGYGYCYEEEFGRCDGRYRESGGGRPTNYDGPPSLIMRTEMGRRPRRHSDDHNDLASHCLPCEYGAVGHHALGNLSEVPPPRSLRAQDFVDPADCLPSMPVRRRRYNLEERESEGRSAESGHRRNDDHDDNGPGTLVCDNVIIGDRTGVRIGEGNRGGRRTAGRVTGNLVMR